MMPVEKQGVSLELAKKLKELGVKQESLFYWSVLHSFRPNTQKSPKIVSESDCRHKRNRDLFSAFTVAELGEMLPKEIKIGNDIYELYTICNSKFGKDDYSWGFSYRKTMYFGRWMDWLYATCEKTEADARAEMLIYLLENGLMGKEEHET